MPSITQPRNLPGGRRVWLDGEVADFVDALHDLDERLALVQTVDGRWEIWRVAEDGQEVIVCRSPRGAKLDRSIIIKLAQNDARRQDVVDRIIKQNDLAEKHRLDHAEESFNVALDRLLSRTWRGRVPTNVEDLNL